MSKTLQLNLTSSQDEGVERRRAGRLLQSGLLTNRGQVLDISVGGLRVSTNRKLRGTHAIMLYTPDGPIEMNASVAWVKRLGFRRFEVGLSFDQDLDNDVRKLLVQLAITHGYCEAA